MRQHGVVEADDAREPGLPGAQPGQEVLPDFGFHRAVDMAALAQLTQSMELWDLMHGFEPTSPIGLTAVRLWQSRPRGAPGIRAGHASDLDHCVTDSARARPYSGENRAKGTARRKACDKGRREAWH
ncbi:hypothetical protein GCM10023259_072370 [Thermocatellispora tengchongensis]